MVCFRWGEVVCDIDVVEAACFYFVNAVAVRATVADTGLVQLRYGYVMVHVR